MDNHDNSNFLITNNILKKYIKQIDLINDDFYSNFFIVETILKNHINNLCLAKNNDLIDESNKIDPWDDAINDNKFYINNKVARIFPLMKNFNNFGNIKIDDDSFSYITIREIADIISKIICYHLLEFNLNPQKIIIADYTAGVGGNILSFSKFFQHVHAVELSQQRAEYLQNNVNIYGYKNITVYNKCGLDFNDNQMITINPNVIFIDPPWGGIDYKNSDKLLLKLGNMDIEELLIDIFNKFSIHYDQIVKNNQKEMHNIFNTKFVVLKLPKNYDIEFLYKFIKKHNLYTNYQIKSYLYILNKMLIVICELAYVK